MHNSYIVLGSDGTVIGTSDDFPSSLVHALLDDSTDVQPEIRSAATELVHQLREDARGCAARTVTLRDQQTVELIAVEAIAIRRVPTDLRVLFTSKLGVIQSQAADVKVTIENSTFGGIAAAGLPGPREGGLDGDNPGR